MPGSAPAVIARDAAGHATIRAVRLAEELRVDGVLDEPAYQTVLSFGDFLQVEPEAGALATERTEAWVFFDDENVYVMGRAWDSAPESRWIANEMRRDSNARLRWEYRPGSELFVVYNEQRDTLAPGSFPEL